MTQKARQQQRQQVKQRLKELLKARPQKQKLQETLMTRPQKQLWLVAMSRVKEAMTMLAEQKGDFGLLYLTDALEIVESIRGPFHGETAKLHVALGGTLQALQKYPRAKQSYQKAIDIYHVLNDSREKNQDQGGHNIYSKRFIQAWIGLGTTNSHQEKWHEAMKAFQSAARLELYNLLVAGMMTSKNRQSEQPEGPQSLTLQHENLLSVRHLRALILSIETNHANNRKQVWSKFPHLPKDISLYLDALQTTVQHEVRGDLLYQRGQFEAAQREYQVALAIFQQQVHASKQSGISWNAIWLLRKQALAALNVVAGNGDKKHREIPPLNHLVEPGFQPHCPGLDKVCQALVDADSMLRDAKFDHEPLLRAFYRMEEARVLAKLYHTTAQLTTIGVDGPVPTTVPQQPQQQPPLSSQSIVEDMKRTLEELRQQLVPEGLSPPSEPRRPINTQLVWQDLHHLSILVEAQESLLATTTHTAGSQPPLLAESSHPSIPSPSAAGVCDAGHGIPPGHPTDPVLEPGMWFVTALVLALLLVAPMLLLRNKMVGPVHNQDKEKKEQNQNKVIPTDHGAKMSLDQQVPVASDPSEETSQPDTIHVIPALTLDESKSTTTGTGSSNSSGKAIAVLQCLDRLEAELQGMSFPLNSSRQFMANKVSALVCLHKTRQALLAQVMGEVEDDDDENNITLDDDNDDDNSGDIKQSGLQMETEFHIFLHRMQELGFESLVANWLNM